MCCRCPWLPFDPDQSLRHQAFHLVYLVTQLPLVVILVRWLTSGGSSRAQ